MNLEKVREAAERVARSEGLEIADVEWKVGKDRILRVFIDRVPAMQPNGEGMSDPYPKISHSDCEKVSQQLSVILDVEELIQGGHYVLEVSSPGMDRALKKPEEFERFRGRLAKIVTTELIENQKAFEGRLQGFVNGKVQLEIAAKVPRVVEIPLEMIRKANLVVEF